MGRKKKVKLEDIAEKLGVSIVTVSNALKGRKGVSDEMREKIMQTAREMGYHNVSWEKKAHNPYIIGVAVAEKYVKEFPSFYMDIYQRIAQEAVKKGHLTVLEVVTSEKESLEKPFEPFLEKKTAGLILIGELKKEYIQAIREKYDIPVVCVDYYDIYEDLDYIVTDGFGGMYQMTELLLDQGYRDLMFVGTPTATKNITDRYLGYCKALEKAGISDAQDKILPDRDFRDGDYRIDIELPTRLPEAFVCNCDKTAGILIQKLSQRGIKVPEDVSVVGFDDYKAQFSEELKLTTYENDEKAIAQISMNTILRRIEGRRPALGTRIVEGNIVEGNTVKMRRS
ncbi:MAG TPA: LacI family DNA-binding transcriptional regulator [Candidatus Mediterraneibacter norfolkensis]|nr:LacI family DNA-binding transcriptional regulator [Candidatus Mediterraneibacter norfolkensis]